MILIFKLLEEQINEFITNQGCTNQVVLFALKNRCGSPDSLKQDIIDYLNETNIYSTFHTRKTVIISFLKYYYEELVPEISALKFKNGNTGEHFIYSFEELNYIIESNIANLTIRRDVLASLMVRMVLYLSWVGLSKDEIIKLRKKDYDIEKHIIHTKNFEYQITSELDPDDVIHKELVKNINALSVIINVNGLKEYSDNISKEVDCDYIIRSQKGGNITAVGFWNSVKHVLKRNIVHKSGWLFRLALAKVDANVYNWNEILTNYNCNCNISLQEYNAYKKIYNHNDKMG